MTLQETCDGVVIGISCLGESSLKIRPKSAIIINVLGENHPYVSVNGKTAHVQFILISIITAQKFAEKETIGTRMFYARRQRRMFHPKLNPSDVLRRLMEESVEILENLQSANYPLESVPPHYASVFLLTDEGNPAYAALGKTEITLLADVPEPLWTQSMLFKLDCESSATHHPIGVFHGFIGAAECAPTENLFFGMLISPTGSAIEGMYLDLSDLSEILPLWKHPYEFAPHLDARYEKVDPSCAH